MYLSLEDDKNSTEESIARLLTQSVCPVKVLWHVPAFHIFIVLSAEPGEEKQICSQISIDCLSWGNTSVETIFAKLFNLFCSDLPRVTLLIIM